ncbi:MAG: alpha/beta-type small acid-soluble spore protein [Clostridia bacterium]|nr:alpha/beta-type small acid-soluble spore protein [Clostridia bacterium]
MDKDPGKVKAEEELDDLKHQVAKELDMNDDIQEKGWENMTTGQVGKIGGEMVREMIKEGKKGLAEDGDEGP